MASRTTKGVALVTGAASGIGRDTGFSFAEAGAQAVIFADLNEPGASEATKANKKYATNPEYTVIAIHVDITSVTSVQDMIDGSIREYGTIDYFVHSAGTESRTQNPVTDASLEELDELFDVNLKGLLICNRAVLKVMSAQSTQTFESRNGTRDVGRGVIINVGSLSSLGPRPGKLPYTVSRYGVTAITKTAALENCRDGIRVNMICPAWVQTPMTDRAREMVPRLDEIVRAVVPAGRMAAPDEVADVIVALCSPAASSITGQAIIVDSGMSLTASQ
ncbi:NAD(P)-binding protein [Lentithecium fluviatile CBS 122367]|uniref:NAD(P)-binding protein n=1 Tax=Lentithecium fluviatile CBS 122367 TaxID=1168545 RepID=A0A6G1IYF5_9PLEO|nr:NAD(P)-binding protein [Lentithecium fluviatile CBS 122367]